MTDGWFNSTSSVNGLFDGWRHSTFLTATPDGDSRDIDTPIALVDKDCLGEAIGQNADLLDSLRQGVAVVRIAWHAAHPNDQSFLVRGRHRHFDAKLVRLTRLALGDALHLGSVQAVKLVFVLRLLCADALGTFNDAAVAPILLQRALAAGKGRADPAVTTAATFLTGWAAYESEVAWRSAAAEWRGFTGAKPFWTDSL